MTSYRVVYSKRSETQLRALQRQIARAASLSIATGFIDALMRECESLRTLPQRGIPYDAIRPGLRMIGFRKRANILFIVGEEMVQVVGVFYGGQDFETHMTGGK